MAVPVNDIAIISIVALFHIIAIIFTVKVGRVFNSKSWNLIVLAFIILLFRRVMSFLDLFGVLSYNGPVITLLDRIYIPLLIWILIGLGMARIYYNIKASMHLEKKLKTVSQNKKQKKKIITSQ